MGGDVANQTRLSPHGAGQMGLLLDYIVLSHEQQKAFGKMASYDANAIALFLGVSSRQLQRMFHRNFGSPPQHWLNRQRISAAKQLLLSEHSIKEVAFELGFKQISHFCRQFKQYAGLPLHSLSKLIPGWTCRSGITMIS